MSNLSHSGPIVVPSGSLSPMATGGGKPFGTGNSLVGLREIMSWFLARIEWQFDGIGSHLQIICRCL